MTLETVLVNVPIAVAVAVTVEPPVLRTGVPPYPKVPEEVWLDCVDPPESSLSWNVVVRAAAMVANTARKTRRVVTASPVPSPSGEFCSPLIAI